MPRSNDNWQFEGFSSPNTTSIPDQYFDWVSPRLSGAESKAMNYIMRRTFGFKKTSDNISLSQMLHGIVKKNGERLDLGAGLAKATLTDALNSLEAKGVIVRKQQWDEKRGGCIASNYQVRFKETTPGSNFGQGYDTPGSVSGQGLSENSTRPLGQKSDTQYTVNNIQLDNNVNVSKNKKGRSPLHKLNDAQHDKEHIKLIAADVLDVLGDEHSERFYLLVARKIPEQVIRRTLAELKEGEVKSPARVFTSKILEHVDSVLEKTDEKAINTGRANLAKKYKSN